VGRVSGVIVVLVAIIVLDTGIRGL